MDLMCTLCFWGNNMQHIPVCVKVIYWWGPKVSGIAKAMSPGIMYGAVVSSAFAAGVSLVSLLQAGEWARVFTLARHYFSAYPTTMDQHHDSIQEAVLGLSE